MIKGVVYGGKRATFTLFVANGEEKKTQQKDRKDPKIHWFFFQLVVGCRSVAEKEET